MVGGKDCKQKYHCSILNVSAMSFGAISDAAVTALSTAAKIGGFYHNTGEGGISRFHLDGGGDLVWNIGTGYVIMMIPFSSVSSITHFVCLFVMNSYLSYACKIKVSHPSTLYCY